MPSRKHLSNKLLAERHCELHAKIKKLLKTTTHVCTTLDAWSNRQMRPYLGVTSHFIADYTLQSVMLACKRLHGSHTGEYISQQFEEILTSFEVIGKVDIAITDNASNMKRAFTLFNQDHDMEENQDFYDDDDSLEPVELHEGGNDADSILYISRISCFAHTLQLTIKDGFKHADQINRILGKILVNHVRHSTVASEIFEKEVRLQMANATRRNSQLAMIRSLLRVSDSTMEAFEYNGKLTAYETSIAKDLVEILTPFEWATNLIQGKVTSSLVIPVVRALRNEMISLGNKFKMRLVTSLKESIHSRLSVYEDELFFQLAAALDPRWKLAWCTPEEATSLQFMIKC